MNKGDEILIRKDLRQEINFRLIYTKNDFTD
jgi:hypothetical protein